MSANVVVTVRPEERTPQLLRVQRTLADLAIEAQVAANRLANMGRKGYSDRINAASLELARVVVAVGNARALPHFGDHFSKLHNGLMCSDSADLPANALPAADDDEPMP